MFRIISDKGVVNIYPGVGFEYEYIKDQQTFKDKSTLEWINLFFAVCLSWITLPMTFLVEVSTTVKENVIPVSGFYSVFGKIVFIAKEKSKKVGAGRLGIIPEVVTRNKGMFLNSKKKKIIFFSICAGILYVCSSIVNTRILFLKRRQRTAVAQKGMACAVCTVNTARVLFRPCMHLCVCSSCHCVTCPKCLGPITDRIFIMH